MEANQDKYYLTVALKIILVLLVALPLKATESRQHEAYKDIISKAQNLSLQKNRAQAINILVRAAKKEKGKAKKELLDSLKLLSEIFYTEKAQQLFELGESIRFSSTQIAIEKYNDALKLEPDNLKVQKSLLGAYLASDQCEKSQELAQSVLLANPYSEEMELGLVQSLLCLKKNTEAKTKLENSELLKRSDFKNYTYMLRARLFLIEGKVQQASEVLKKALELDSRFPELYWLEGQIAKKNKQDFVEPYQKYLAFCQNLSNDLRKKYILEPRLCLEKEEVASEVEHEISQQSEN